MDIAAAPAMKTKSLDYLPEEIIHHIQSYMNEKQAVRSSLLSKSWYDAWSTRPILAFDVHIKQQYMKQDDNAAILESILRTMKRYKETNINLQRLKICITRADPNDYIYKYCNSLIDRLIGDVSELGVNEIHLEGNWGSNQLHVPPTVFTVTRMTKLSIHDCQFIKKLPPVDTISPLVYLRLKSVRIAADNRILQDILLRCPSIQNLDIQSVYQEWRPTIILGELHNLVSLRVDDDWYARTKVSFHSITNGQLVNTVHEFHKLRSVCLKQVRIVGDFFTNFSSRFPCIEDLSLSVHWCDTYRSIHMSSKSLKYLNLELYVSEKAEFDVPNIRKFGFNPCSIPALSFSTVSTEWESKVEFSLSRGTVETSWFVELGEFLKGLSKSKISLCLNICLHVDMDSGAYVRGMDVSGHDLPCSPTNLVENLTVNDYHPEDEAFLTALVIYCRPTWITVIPRPYMSSSEAIEFVQHAPELFANQKKATKCSSMMENLITYHFKKFEEKTFRGEWDTAEMKLEEKTFQLEWHTVEMEEIVNSLKLNPHKDVGGYLRVKWGASDVVEPSL